MSVKKVKELRLTRKTVLTANTQFMSAKYFPTGVHVLTCGTDGRIGYWSAYNGSLIRELQGSLKSSINCVAINGTGDYFVSVDSEQSVKLWDYNKGIVVARGNEHASPVKSVAFSPCRKFFVTGCTDGAIIIWDTPKEHWGKVTTTPRPNDSAEVKPVKSEPKIPTSSRSNHNQKIENIDRLVASAAKNKVCCVECPPINVKNKPKEQCNIVTDVRKC